MPKSLAVSLTSSVSEMLAAVARLTSEVQEALASPRLREAASSVRTSAKSVAKAAGPKVSRLKESLKAHWAKLTPAQHKARIKKMLAGRGLKPVPESVKARRAASPRSKALKKAIKASWAKMTP